jgi:TetR/AcrR family transcriptional regulator, transcriptional repressor for nem operon
VARRWCGAAAVGVSAATGLGVDDRQTAKYPSSMGRRSDARERLVAAAIEALWRFGYHGATVERICEAAHARRGSFHYFFKTKDELVLAAIDAAWLERQPLLDAIFSPRLDPLARLEGYFDAIAMRQRSLKRSYGRVVGCFFTSLGSQLDGASPEIAARVKQALDVYQCYYVSAVCEAVARGQLVLAEPERKARDVFAFVLGVLSQARVHDDLVRVERLKTAALEMLGGCSTQEARAS